MIRSLLHYQFSFGNIVLLLMRMVIILLAVSIHEYAHGYTAYKLGDYTAKYDGRLTLNPLKHLDPFGALCMFLFGFGWARPVMIDTRNYKKPKRDTALVALAGPLANILIAYIFMLLFLYVSPAINNRIITQIIAEGMLINIGLAVFNIIPIPPLDGSKILLPLLPSKIYWEIMRYERYGFLVLMAALYLDVLTPLLNILNNGVIHILFYLAGGGLL